MRVGKFSFLSAYSGFAEISIDVDFIKNFRPVRMKIPLVLIRSKYQRKLPLARELFLVASREPTVDVRSESQIVQIYSNLSNLFPICLICTDLYDFCPLGHSFFSHHIATYREHHFQSYRKFLSNSRKFVLKKRPPPFSVPYVAMPSQPYRQA